MPANNDKKKVLALMFAVIGIVLLMVSLMLPWWGVHYERDSESKGGNNDYHSESGGGISVTSGLAYGVGRTSLYSGSFSTPIVFGVTAMFLILALIFSSLMITAILLSWFGKLRKAKLPMIFGILAIIFCLLAPIVFMAALPSAMKTDAEKNAENSGGDYEAPDHDDPTKSFFGNYEDTEEDEYDIDKTKQNWGGDIGWILSFVSFAMLLISVVMVIPRRRKIPPPPPEPIYKRIPSPPHQEQYDRGPLPEQYDRGPPPQRFDRVPPPPPQDLGYDHQPARERYPPTY